MRIQQRLRTRPLRAAVILALAGGMGLSGSAVAMDFQWGDVRGSWDNSVNVGASWRVQDRDPNNVGKANNFGSSLGPPDFQTYRAARDVQGRWSVNGDQGNLGYDQWDLIENTVAWTSELSLSYNNMGAFVRTNAFYDFESNRRDFEAEARDQIVRDFRLLDAYVYFDFDVAGRAASVRVGNQVVSWGESTFIQQGINVINAVDVSRLRAAGSELRDAFLPHNMIWGQVNLTDNVSVEGFVLFEWDQIEIDPAGSYFSTSDFVGYGGEYVMLGFGVLDDDLLPDGSFPPGALPRERTQFAKQSGQFGVSLRWFLPEMNFSELGFYAINYHSRLPVISGRSVLTSDTSSGAYFTEYPEDIRLFGVSLNTTLPGGLSLGTEVSYRPNMPLQIDDVELLFSGLTPLNALIPEPANRFVSQLGEVPPGTVTDGFVRHKVSQFQFTLTKLLGPGNWVNADDVALVGEAGFTQVWDLPDKSELRYEGPGTNTGGGPDIDSGGLRNPVTQQDGFADDFSWGYRLLARADYNSVFGSSWTLSPQIGFQHDVNGTSPGPGGNFIEGRTQVTLGLNGNYLQRWQVGASYTIFSGAKEFNALHDRDFVAFNVRYNF